MYEDVDVFVDQNLARNNENTQHTKSELLTRFSFRNNTEGQDDDVMNSDSPDVQDINFSFPITCFEQLSFIPTKLTTTEFKGVEFIKHGSNSSIFSAYLRGEKVAVKLVKEKPKNLHQAEKELVFEAGVLARLKHPNIINILGVGEKVRKFLVLELLEGGTLSDVIKGYQRPGNSSSAASPAKLPANHYQPSFSMPTQDIIKIARSLISAMKYLHETLHPAAMIIHRDLKPQNIGFTKDGTLKVFDFGLMACVKRRTHSTEAYKMTGYTGTVVYMAPEVALRQPYTEKVDIYSFGMILWQMTSGIVPFAGMYQDEYMEKVVRGGFRPAIRDDLPQALISLIERCWDANPFDRPSCTEILALLDSAKEMAINKKLQSSGGFGAALLKLFKKRGYNNNSVIAADDDAN